MYVTYRISLNIRYLYDLVSRIQNGCCRTSLEVGFAIAKSADPCHQNLRPLTGPCRPSRHIDREASLPVQWAHRARPPYGSSSRLELPTAAKSVRTGTMRR
jgi:hypothetical protein